MSSVLNPYSSQNHPVRGRLGHPDLAGRRWLQCGEKEGQLKVSTSVSFKRQLCMCLILHGTGAFASSDRIPVL